MRQMTSVDREAGYELLKTGSIVNFEIVKTDIHEGPDSAEFSVEIQLAFPPDSEAEENDLQWGAFGFFFVIGTLSFADARPREASMIDYVENDEFQLGDFVSGLCWEGAALRFRADYLRGRRMKTDFVLRPDGSGKLTTTGRGMTPLRWLERLQGEGRMRLVKL